MFFLDKWVDIKFLKEQVLEPPNDTNFLSDKNMNLYEYIWFSLVDTTNTSWESYSSENTL